ncbi:MAG: PilA1 [candidate division WS6 bacterium GW2011_GWA2_37_6]|uniref:PilA1 n=1 Tax=candidate division WS6 bacterium GW2011_GWA2_37_6 TaxID=1619087 RepID=A0A0G0JF15_9BACT|nr:MAG: PilA1 [candidate division WS6 bacterium GW2011_GWA2_37_6]
MKRKLKGFTLVELLAAMAIIAVLIALAGFGISLALRNSRNSQRQESLDNVRIAITDYYGQSTLYPTSIAGAGAANQILLKNGALTVGTAIPAKGATKPEASTSTSGSVYRYGVVASGYYLCVQQEGGTWFDLSTATVGTCETNGTAVTP